MKFTLDDCVTVINQILNYPSVAYTDISHFFDQAISELNSELHIGLRPISYLYSKSTFNLSNFTDVIMLDSKPLPVVATNDKNANVYFDTSTKKIMYLKGADTVHTAAKDQLFGVYAYFDENSESKEVVREIYQTIIIGDNAYWSAYGIMPTREVDLLEILPYDFITLFLIPYICFKYTVRDGDSGALYAEEFSNGFQQLQKSYDIPSFVVLSTQAGKPAYKEDVENNLDNLNIKVPTRAIYESMRVDKTFIATYGGIYDTGGWL